MRYFWKFTQKCTNNENFTCIAKYDHSSSSTIFKHFMTESVPLLRATDLKNYSRGEDKIRESSMRRTQDTITSVTMEMIT